MKSPALLHKVGVFFFIKFVGYGITVGPLTRIRYRGFLSISCPISLPESIAIISKL